MKITDIEVIPVQAPSRTLIPVLVHTDEGLTGLGEAGLQRRWKAIVGAAEHIKPWLVGQDASRIEYLWQRLFRGGFYPGDRLIGSLISAIDIALWDIKGQALGVPVYELLGGRCRDHVEVFTPPTFLPPSHPSDSNGFLKAVLDDADARATSELALRCVGHGHKFFRLGPPKNAERFDSRQSARKLIAQLRAVRDAVGDKLELMVDLHTRLAPDEAVAFCREVEPLALFAVEDPIRSEHMSGYHRLRRQTRVPLAAGEQWANKWEFREAIEHELIDFARLDVCIGGGISEAMKVAAMAETHLVRMLMHNPLGPICTAASLHIDLARDNAGPQELFHAPGQMLPDVFECSFELKDLKLTAPTTPGLGVKFNTEAARKYPAQMTEPPHYHRPDGSFTNY